MGKKGNMGKEDEKKEGMRVKERGDGFIRGGLDMGK